MGIISQRLRDSARGRDCTFRIPGICNGDPETTVLCHAPSGTGGMGTKGHDFLAAFGCSNCHMALDQQIVPNQAVYWLRGIMETWTAWVIDGLIEVPSFKASEPEKAKRKPGKKANFPSRKLPTGRKIPSRPFPKRTPFEPMHAAQLETQATGSSTDGRYE